MKKRLLSLVLTITLALAFLPQIYAYDASVMTDISSHWGYENIVWAVEQDLFKGVTDTEFQPNEYMTRGMFVTVLGRMSGIDPAMYDDWYLGNLYTDVNPNSYYAPYINWATRYGIANGMGGGTFMPDEYVTREQIATFLVRYASIYNYNLIPISDEAVESFTDADSVSRYAVSAVDSMRLTGLFIGRSNGDGTYCFCPKDNATRAEAATIMYRLSTSLALNTDLPQIAPTSLTLLPEMVDLYLGERTSLIYELLPADATNQTVTWVSEDPSIATVDKDGVVTAVSEGTVEVYCYTWNGYFGSTTVTCQSQSQSDLASWWETYDEKCMRLFGEVVTSYGYSYRNYYSTDAEARAHMVSVTIKAWDFADSSRTTKTTKQYTLTVHENIADTVIAIFDEIYNGEEQFPIHSIGCYRFELGSEHSIGVAIDINPNENYYYNYRTGQQVGSYWKPGEDPYSIPTDGEVAQIFNKYGFSQGIWSSSVDYMHFSYFGT